MGLLRRYGAQEPTVAVAMLHLLGACADRTLDDPVRTAHLRRHAALVVTAAERAVAPEDLGEVVRAAEWAI